MNEVICKEVVITSLLRRGKGEMYSPIRCITQIWEKDGTLIAENDPNPDSFQEWHLISFCRWMKNNNHNPDNTSDFLIKSWLKDVVEK
jgi:hypothetical protein